MVSVREASHQVPGWYFGLGQAGGRQKHNCGDTEAPHGYSKSSSGRKGQRDPIKILKHQVGNRRPIIRTGA